MWEYQQNAAPTTKIVPLRYYCALRKKLPAKLCRRMSHQDYIQCIL